MTAIRFVLLYEEIITCCIPISLNGMGIARQLLIPLVDKYGYYIL